MSKLTNKNETATATQATQAEQDIQNAERIGKNKKRVAVPLHAKFIKSQVMRQYGEFIAKYDSPAKIVKHFLTGPNYLTSMCLLIAWTENEFDKSEFIDAEKPKTEKESKFTEFVRRGREGFSRQLIPIGKADNGDTKVMTLGHVDSQLWGETFKQLKGVGGGRGRTAESMDLLAGVDEFERFLQQSESMGSIEDLPEIDNSGIQE